MADKPALRPDVAVGETLKAIARDTLSQARRALEDQQKPSTVAVHDYRKAMKRWRSQLRLLQGYLGEDGRRLRIEARDFARELSGARDAQAAIGALDDLVATEAELPPRTVASIRRRLDEARVSAEAAMLRQAVRARLIIGVENAAAAIEGWALDQLTFAEIARELTRTYRRLREEAPEDWRAAEPEVLHALRSRVVVHRYQMELIAPLWPKFGRVWVAESQRLRDRLGAFQDLSVLQGFTVAHAALAPWRSRLLPPIRARRATHAEVAQRIAGGLLAEKPKAFRRRIEALWQQGRR